MLLCQSAANLDDATFGSKGVCGDGVAVSRAASVGIVVTPIPMVRVPVVVIPIVIVAPVVIVGNFAEYERLGASVEIASEAVVGKAVVTNAGVVFWIAGIVHSDDAVIYTPCEAIAEF